MIDPDTRIGVGSPATVAAGLRTPPSELYRNMSMAQFTPRPRYDLQLEQQRQDALNLIAGLGRDIAPRIQPPPGRPGQGSSGIYYNPALDRYSIGGTEFGSRDYDVALRASELMQRGDIAPQGGGWRGVLPEEYAAYLNDISTPRSFLENVGMGARYLGEGFVGGLGRAAQMAGAEGVGGALVGVGEALGPSEASEARSAAIRERQGFAGQVGTAVAEGLPSIAASVGAAIGGARVGATIGGGIGSIFPGVGTGIGAGVGAGLGAFVGAALSISPMELQSSWEAAEQRASEGGPPVDDPEVQTEILLATLAKTGGQSLVPGMVGRGFSVALREATSEAVQRTMGGRVARGIGAGAMEGSAEAFAVLVDRVVFDPELRAQLDEGDIAALTPLVFQKYGEEVAVAFAAGAVLGGPLGALGPTPTPRARRDVDSGEATDGLTGANLEPQPTLGLPAPEPMLALPAPQRALPAPENVPTLGAPSAVPQIEAATFRAPEPNIPQGELLLRGGRGTAPVISMPGEVAPQPVVPPRSDPRQGTLLREDELSRMQAMMGATPVAAAVPNTQLGQGLAALRQRMEFEAQAARAQELRTAQEQALRETQARRAEQQRVEQGVPELQMEPEGTLARRNQLREQMQARMARVSEVTPETLAQENPALAAQLREQGLLPPAIPAGHFGTKKGQPFSSELAARGQRNRVAKENNLAPTNLTPVEVPGGWALRNDTPRPPKPKKPAPSKVDKTKAAQKAKRERKKTAVEKVKPAPKAQAEAAPEVQAEPTATQETQVEAAVVETPAPKAERLKTKRAPKAKKETPSAVQEPSAEARPARQEPRARTRVREEDTQGQEATRAREAKDETVDEQSRAEKRVVVGGDEEVETLTNHILEVETATSDETFVENLAEVMWWSKNGQQRVKQRAQKFLDQVRQDPETRDLFTAAEQLETAQGSASKAEKNSPLAVDLLGENLGYQYQLIAQTIQDLNSGRLENLTQSRRGQLVAAWKKIKDSDPQYGGEPLANFIKPNSLDFFNFGPRDPQTDIRPVVSSETGRTKLSSYDTILNPLPKGRVEMLARTFAKKLAIKPKLSVVRNVDELQRRSPALFAEADASRPQGDFAELAKRAAGYSFADGKVLIFSDNIESADQLRAVLAHETLGHFGMRGVVGDAPFNKLMTALYDESDYIRFNADATMNSREMSKAEAVEEYLADYAARLETSLIARIWNMLKNGLNNLGLKFGDDAARYLVSQARRYVRTGRSGDFFINSNIARRIHNMESGLDVEGSGRFAMADPRPLSTLGIAGGALNGDTPFFSRERLVSTFKDVGEFYDRAKRDFFALSSYRALKNEGLAKFYGLLKQAASTAMMLKNNANTLLRDYINYSGKAGGTLTYKDGTVRSQKDAADEMLYSALSYGASKWKMRPDAKRKPLVYVENGEVKRDPVRIAELRAQGRRTLKDFREGFEYTVYVETTMDDAERARLRAERDAKLQDVTDQAERDRIAKDYKARMDEESYLKESTGKFEGIPELTEKSLAWRFYTNAREALEEVEIQLVEAHYKAHLKLIDNQLAEINRAMGQRMTSADRGFLLRMNEKYISLFTADLIVSEDGAVRVNPDSMDRADAFLRKLNEALIANDPAATDAGAAKRNAALLEDFDASQHDDITASIEDFKTRFKDPNKRRTSDDPRTYIIQNKLKEIVHNEVSRNDGGYAAERSIATGYLPLVRKGRYQIQVQAFDAAGKLVPMKETFQRQLSYHQLDSLGEAQVLEGRLNDMFGDNTQEIIGADGNRYTVTLRAKTSAALEGIVSPPQLNLNEFIMGLRRYSINLDPRKMKEIIQDMTEQNSRARNRLQRQFVPGAEMDGAQATSQHVESRASTIAKVLMRPELDQLLNPSDSDSRKLWFGDEQKLERLKQEYDATLADPNSTDAARKEARKAYDTYKYQMSETNKRGANRGNEFLTEASRLLSFIESQKNLDDTDFASGDIASQVRAYTALAQLGLSPATAALNLISLGTNTLPFLATYNSRTGFGGGFGIAVVPAITKAMAQVGGPGLANSDMNTAEYYDALAKNENAAKKLGLTVDEAAFLAELIRSGKAQPVMFNAMVASARGRMTGKLGTVVDTTMFMFNRTDSASRRAAGLAAYRLQYDRSIQSGKPPEQAALDAAQFADQALDLTLGNYSVTERPAMWRGGVQQFAFMYQVFPVMSVSLLQNMGRTGQLAMLAGLLALSGVSGLPFAEDIEDLVDTISAMLGLKTPSIRLEMAKAIDEVLPGMSPSILRGFVNAFMPGDAGVRLSLGNMLPGTGMFLPGADVTRELFDIAGPVGGFAQASLATVGSLAGWAAYSAGVSPRPASLEAVGRNAPITMVRAWSDAFAYTQSGAVVDRRGYVISEDMDAMTVIARALGFFPTAASDEYGTIRVAQRVGNMQRDVAAAYYNAYVQARLRGDMAQANQVLREVRQWNQQAQGSGMEIRNFQANAIRRFREAQRPASERTIRSAPRNLQDSYEEAAELLGY